MKKKRKPHTRRYQKTDQKLINVAYKISDPLHKPHITVKELVLKAEVNASTFYRHFRNIFDFSRRHEKILKSSSEDLLTELAPKASPPESLFFQINRLIYLNRASVRFLFASKNDNAIRQIFWILRPLITRNWASYGYIYDQYIYCFFVAEATEAVRLWSVGHGFNKKYIEIITNQLSYVSRTIAPSLAPIIKKADQPLSPLPKEYF